MADFTEYLGVIGRTHGTDGTVMLVDTTGAELNLPAGTYVGVGFSREFVKHYAVAAFEGRPPHLRLRLTGIDTPEKAAALIDHAVYGEPGAVTASDERYAIGELEGCSVVLDDGSHLGTITDVWLMPANDVWIVTQPDGHTIPLPVIDPVVLNVDMAQRIITVHLLDGLADINRPSSEESDA